MRLDLAVERTVMLSIGPDNTPWSISSDEPNLEMLLGIEINVQGRNLIMSREKKMISTARNYALNSQELCTQQPGTMHKISLVVPN